MSGKGLFWEIACFLARLILFAALIMLTSGALAWMINWRTAYKLGDCFFMVGLLVVAGGAYSILGHFSAARQAKAQQVASVRSDDIRERAARAARDLSLVHSFTFQLFLVGLIIIITGILLQSIP